MTDIPPPHSDYAQPRRASKKQTVIWIIVVLAVVAGIVWYANGAGKSTPVVANGGGRHSHGAGSGPVPVVSAVAQKGDIDITHRELGTVTPLANVTVRTQINGQLQQIGFTEGQIVQAGDFLAQIDPRPYQLLLAQAQGSLQRDEALLKDAKIDLERYKMLVKEDSIARQQLDTQQSVVDQDAGNVLTDQSAIATQQLNLTYCHVVAPVTGRVGLRQVDAGNYVQTSDTNGLVTLTQLQPITVIFTLPEDDLPVVMKRLGAGAELKVVAFDRNQTTQLAVGKLVSVDNQIDTSTGTVKMRAQFDNTDNVLFPNQFVNADLLVDTLKDTVVVPSAAIQRGSPGTFVYLIKDDNTVTVKVVKLGPSQGDNVAITEGLNAGDKIVIDGADKLREGAKVTLPTESDSNKERDTSADDQSNPDPAGTNTASPAATNTADPKMNPSPDGSDQSKNSHGQHHHHHKTDTPSQ